MKLATPDRDDGTAGQYRFGDVVVDALAHTLQRAGAPQQIEPKAFAVLLALLRRPGELVERDELLDLVWGHRHVTPGVLTRAIAQLRHALEDDSHNPRYIQTQHAMGYRFIGVLEEGGGVAAVAGGMTGPDREPSPVLLVPGSAQAGEPEAEPAPEPEPEPTPAPGHDPAMDAPLALPGTPAGTPGGVFPAPVADPAASGTRAHPPPRAWPWLAAGAVLALALAAAWWLQGRAPAVPRPAEASIAVLPFTTLSDDHDDRYFAEGLAVE